MSEARRIAMGLFIMVIGLYLFLLSNPPWDTPTSSTQFYSVLAFLTITITVSALNRIRTDPTPANHIFAAGTIYASIIFGGASIYYLLTPETVAIQSQTSGIFLNLVALASTGIIMMLYSHLEGRPISEDSRWHNRFLIPVFSGFSAIVFVTFMVIARLSLDQIIFVVGGYIVGILAIVFYILSILFLMGKRQTEESHDLMRLKLSFLLLIISSAIMIIILPNPSSLWLVSIVMMALAFIFAIIATTYPFLTNIGISRQTAYGISAGMSALVILPFLIANLVESLSTTNYLPDFGAAVIIHLGGGVFAAMLSYTLFVMTKERPAPYRDPIVLALAFWSVVEISLGISAMLYIVGIETGSILPYLFGITSSFILVTQAIRKTLSTSDEKPSGIDYRVIFLLCVIYSVLIIAGEIIRYQFSTVFLENGLGKSTMLILSYLTLFMVFYFILLLAGIYGGRVSIESIVAGSITVWLVIVIIKVNFVIWTAGYWVAEGLMAICLGFLPIVLTIIYVRENRSLTLIQQRVDTYSSFLTKHITDHHQRTLDSLEQLSMNLELDDEQLRILSSSLDNISLAEDLTKHIGVLIYGDSFPTEELDSVDLVDSIAIGFSRLSRVEPDLHAQISINKEKGQFYVVANSLLSDAFFQTFHGVIKRIGIPDSFSAAISKDSEEKPNTCQALLKMIIKSGDVERQKGLLERYTKGEQYTVIEFEYARRMIHLFGGEFSITSRIESAERLEISFEIFLNAAPNISDMKRNGGE